MRRTKRNEGGMRTKMDERWKIQNQTTLLPLLLLLLLPHVQSCQIAQVVKYIRRELGEVVIAETPFHEKNQKKREEMNKTMDEMELRQPNQDVQCNLALWQSNRCIR